MKKLLLLSVFSALVLAVALPAPAQEKKAATEGKEKKAPGPLPFNGKITAMDAAAKTITLSGKEARVVQITSSTKITKDGKPATLDDIKAGDQVGGAFRKNADGKMEATTLNAGVRPEGKGKGKAKGKDKGDDKK
ncbi:MAG: copper-binding protein [Verrucomicrobia bacterium]|nr:copper-binding protein [Verrucomicrobiota bacterium]